MVFKLAARTAVLFAVWMGGDLVSLRQNIDTTLPAGRLTFAVLGAVAEFEREMLRERVKAGMAQARRAGNVSVHDLEDAGACGAAIQCPQCQRRMGEVLFPNLRDTQEAAALGNEEARLQLPKLLEKLEQAEIRVARFERTKIVSIEQLPELTGDNLEFIWDLAETDGESYQVIRLGHVELWRELAFFENIDRFNQVKELLRQKYGVRFRSLTPSRNSLEWLCGDNAGKLFRLSYT